MSFFVPFGGQQNNPDGPQIGLTWTLEMFANTEEGAAAAGVGEPGAEANGNAAPAPEPAPNAEQRPEAAGASPTPPAPGPEGQNQNPNPAQNQEGGRQGAGASAGGQGDGPARSIFFIVGPDGNLLRRGGENVDDAPPAPFPFPFTFPFNPFGFAPGPPPPDPAKAAELLNSLPTVGRALLKRVDKIVAAEDAQRGDSDSSGWQCGICLEGLEVGTTVKALPCNHLFHETCLQPWFTNHHHTCPTCRLDLDPFRTLHEPARRAPLRPTTTGSGRGTPATRAPHPYARPGAAGAAGAEGRRSRPTTQPGTPQNEPAEGAEGGDRLEVPTNPLDAMFDLARMFGLTASPAPMREGEQPEQAGEQRQGEGEGERGRASSAPAGDAQAAANAPNAPAGEQTTAPAAGAEQAPGTRDGLVRPTPERRQHITFFPFRSPLRQEPTPAPPAAAADAGAGAGTAAEGGAQAPAQGEEPREATPAPAPGANADNAGPRAGPNPWAALLSGAIPFEEMFAAQQAGARAADEEEAPAPNPAPAPAEAPANGPADGTAAEGATNGPANGDNANGTAGANGPGPNAAENGDRHTHAHAFRIPYEFVFLRPPPGGRFAGSPAPAPAEPPQPPPAPENKFVPQSLESWTAQREKTLGWRCDAVECLIAPPVPDADTMDVDDDAADDAEDMDVDAADKEMLAIYAESQAPFPPHEVGEEPHVGQEFVLLACAHRWHRACLETAARSAGHSTAPDDSGREWIRCARCRKEGWIVPRAAAPPAESAEAPVATA